MNYTVNTTEDYHRNRLATLGWELTVCNALSSPESPCRSILTRNDSYGHLLYDYLKSILPIEKLRSVIEIGGGYGYLMRDFLDRNSDLRATMLDISPHLLEKQRETLRDHEVTYRHDDFLAIEADTLVHFDLAIMNENLGDFPTLLDLSPVFFTLPSSGLDERLKRARYFFELYALPHPDRDMFHLNIGALEAVEKLCQAHIPFIFLGEHSCEASIPESMRHIVSPGTTGNPERIALMGHDEYTIKFSYLETVARSWDYITFRGTFADFIPIDWTDKLRSILSLPYAMRDEYEIIRHFVTDLFQYEYLILLDRNVAARRAAEGSDSEAVCTRCGKCCFTDFIAYTTEEDRDRWKREGRQDILDTIEREHAIWVGDHFISADNGRYIRCCPFLTWSQGLHACAIYRTRPVVCRNYVPGSSEICSQWERGEDK